MVKVKVPQDDGEIVITRGGEAPQVFAVKKGLVDVADQELDLFLLAVEGATVASDSSSGSSSSNAKPETQPAP